ncbi:MAG: hypothetical protein ABIA93_00410 [Candidatus Woesearchaeota archaeon]
MFGTLLDSEEKALGALVAALDDADTSMFPIDDRRQIYEKASESLAERIRSGRPEGREAVICRAAALTDTITGTDFNSMWPTASAITEAITEHAVPHEQVAFFMGRGNKHAATRAFHEAVTNVDTFRPFKYLMNLADKIEPGMSLEERQAVGLGIVYQAQDRLRLCDFSDMFKDFRFAPGKLTVDAMVALEEASYANTKRAGRTFDKLVAPIVNPTTAVQIAIRKINNGHVWTAERLVESALSKGGAEDIRTRRLLMRASGDAQSTGMRRISRRINDALALPFNLDACFDDMVHASETQLESAYDPFLVVFATHSKSNPVWNTYSVPYFIGEPILDLPEKQLQPYAQRALETLTTIKDSVDKNCNWLGLYFFTKKAMTRLRDTAGLKLLEEVTKAIYKRDEPAFEHAEQTRKEPLTKSPEFMQAAREAYERDGIYGIEARLLKKKGSEHPDPVDVLEEMLKERGVNLGEGPSRSRVSNQLLQTPPEAVTAHRQILEYQLERGRPAYGLGFSVLLHAWHVLSTQGMKDPLVSDPAKLAAQFAVAAMSQEEHGRFLCSDLYKMEPVIARHLPGFRFPQNTHRNQAASHLKDAARSIASGHVEMETDSWVAGEIYRHTNDTRMLQFLEANGLYNPAEHTNAAGRD